jgi:hypothetical protein
MPHFLEYSMPLNKLFTTFLKKKKFIIYLMYWSISLPFRAQCRVKKYMPWSSQLVWCIRILIVLGKTSMLLRVSKNTQAFVGAAMCASYSYLRLVLWVVTPYSLVDRFQRFGAIWCSKLATACYIIFIVTDCYSNIKFSFVSRKNVPLRECFPYIPLRALLTLLALMPLGVHFWAGGVNSTCAHEHFQWYHIWISG